MLALDALFAQPAQPAVREADQARRRRRLATRPGPQAGRGAQRPAASAARPRCPPHCVAGPGRSAHAGAGPAGTSRGACFTPPPTTMRSGDSRSLHHTEVALQALGPFVPGQVLALARGVRRAGLGVVPVDLQVPQLGPPISDAVDHQGRADARPQRHHQDHAVGVAGRAVADLANARRVGVVHRDGVLADPPAAPARAGRRRSRTGRGSRWSARRRAASARGTRRRSARRRPGDRCPRAWPARLPQPAGWRVAGSGCGSACPRDSPPRDRRAHP